jgi:hypothetical protein
MASVIEHYSKFEVCAVVSFLQAQGVSQSKIHRMLVSVYDRSVSDGQNCLLCRVK